MKMNQPGSKVTLEENHNPWRKQLSYPGFFPFDTFSINVFDCSNALHGSDPLYRALGWGEIRLSIHFLLPLKVQERRTWGVTKPKATKCCPDLI
ncbi:hypothetical protein BLNAU_19259 [Blattamonas nauphoetae]|uniref:Uncharacterized protein n=1 Tax=Blattamonas nauphoetae TaxID=2049346 RepID=A0ABQ9X3A2_9EUKA|nr:hypothetical protein BLNAU_19259 [Blattamonas nauphoetae]